MEKILGYENSNQFKTKRVKVSRDESGIIIRTLGPEISFQQMKEYRTKISARVIYDELRTGHIFANLGVSSILTINLDGNNYLITVKQDRKDFGDFVAKLVSGYLDSKDLRNPGKALRKEISEEILPVTSDENLVRFIYQGKNIGNPFSEHFQDYSAQMQLDYPARFHIQDLETAVVSVDGSQLKEPAGLYFHAPFNSAQLVFSYHLSPENLDFNNLRISLHHSEDKLKEDERIIEKIFHPLGILLIKIKNKKLTDKVYSLSNGKLIAVNPKIVTLSEVFAEKYQGTTKAKNISLTDYLDRK